MLDVQALDGGEGFPNLSRLGSTLEDAAVPSTSDCLFLVSSAPGAELAAAVVMAEAACLHLARKKQYNDSGELKRFGPDPHPEIKRQVTEE